MGVLTIEGELRRADEFSSSIVDTASKTLMELDESLADLTEYDKREITLAAGGTLNVALAGITSATFLLIRMPSATASVTINVNGLGTIPLTQLCVLMGTLLTSLTIVNGSAAAVAIEIVLAK